jgi:predicted amidohydrolase
MLETIRVANSPAVAHRISIKRTEVNMRIGFLTDGKLSDFEKYKQAQTAELCCFAFGSVGEVNYEKEVRGETNEMEEVALFSRHFSCVAVVGCYTDTKGIKRKSAIVADKGKILGVSDMTHGLDGDGYKCGSGVRVYDTSAGRIGVLVGQDVYFSELTASLARCGGETIVCAYEQTGENIEQVLLRADSFRYGVTMCMCARGYAQIADPSGKIAFASPLSPVWSETDGRREYHLVETRRRGFYRPQGIY